MRSRGGYADRGVAELVRGLEGLALLLPRPLSRQVECGMPPFFFAGESSRAGGNGWCAELVYGGIVLVSGAQLNLLLKCSQLLRQHAGGMCACVGAGQGWALAPIQTMREEDGCSLNWESMSEMVWLDEAAGALEYPPISHV